MSSIPPVFTGAQRAEEIARLSEDDEGFIIAALAADHPGTFDSILLDLKRRPSGLEEVTL